MKEIEVILADDHAIVRSGLRHLLSKEEDIKILCEAGDGVTALECCRKLNPHIVIMDISMPGLGGIAATKEIVQLKLKTKVLGLTMHEDVAYLRAFMNAGGKGYVLKKDADYMLVNAVRVISKGKEYVTPELLKEVPLHSTISSKCTDVRCYINGSCELEGSLTNREREVLSNIALGYTNREISEKLHISEKTIETHRSHILEKLHLKSRADIVRYALEHDLMK